MNIMSTKCEHVITYYNAVNFLNKGEIVAVADIYHCRICKKLFADLRRIGLPFVLEPKLGFEELEEGNDWFLLVCYFGEKYIYSLVQTEIGKKTKHTCIGGVEKEIECLEEDNFYGNEIKHKLIRLRKYLGKAVDFYY
jgi:hypothetical protein